LRLNVFDKGGFCGQKCFVCKDIAFSIGFIFYKYPLLFEEFYVSEIGKREIFPSDCLLPINCVKIF
jgi:hypothetical protein